VEIDKSFKPHVSVLGLLVVTELQNQSSIIKVWITGKLIKFLFLQYSESVDGYEILLRKMTGVEIKSAIVADLSMEVSKLYVLIHEKASITSTLGAVFFIDPGGIVRMLIYYPASTWGNIDEILRVLDSLTYLDSFTIATPENWKLGEDIIVPSP
jgi:alkyl hydroperoxide reductase subunit AhpC